MSPRHIPNLLTVVRVLMVPVAMYELVRGHYLSALVIMAAAALTDGLDGYLARRFGWQSRLGAVLDPVADKLLMIASYVTLGYLGYIPLWLSLLVVGRDLVIMAGAATYYALFRRLDVQPTLLSKGNTLLQVALLVLVVGGLAGLDVPAAAKGLLVGLVALTTTASGVHYVWTWSLRAYRTATRGE